VKGRGGKKQVPKKKNSLVLNRGRGSQCAGGEEKIRIIPKVPERKSRSRITRKKIARKVGCKKACRVVLRGQAKEMLLERN